MYPPVFSTFTIANMLFQTCQTVWVLGEGYSPDDEGEVAVKEVTKLWVYQARYQIPISKAPVGSWFQIEGVDAMRF